MSEASKFADKRDTQIQTLSVNGLLNGRKTVFMHTYLLGWFFSALKQETCRHVAKTKA
jgi:hypothetical protein